VPAVEERQAGSALAARPAGKPAAETVPMMTAVLRRLRLARRGPIILDHDPGFVRHGVPASAGATAAWFGDAHASWLEGAVGNAKGRSRRDLPRDLDLGVPGDAEPWESVRRHEPTPRQDLGRLVPLQALLEEPGGDVRLRFARPGRRVSASGAPPRPPCPARAQKKRGAPSTAKDQVMPPAGRKASRLLELINLEGGRSV
jgi:hypothetical protein